MRTGGISNACTKIRAGVLIALMFNLIPIFMVFNKLTQTTHYIASFFCILGAFMITLKTNPNLCLQAHALITENTALVSLAAFLHTHTPRSRSLGLAGRSWSVWVWVGSHTNWTGVVGCAS